jgi:hypothetical protein
MQVAGTQTHRSQHFGLFTLFHAELKHVIAPTKPKHVAGMLQDLQFERACSSVQVPTLSFFSSTGPLPPCVFTFAGLVVSGNKHTVCLEGIRSQEIGLQVLLLEQIGIWVERKPGGEFRVAR